MSNESQNDQSTPTTSTKATKSRGLLGLLLDLVFWAFFVVGLGALLKLIWRLFLLGWRNV